MARQHEARQFTSPLALHGEGAYWDRGRGAWLWVDMLAGRLMITGIDGDTASYDLPDPIAAAARPVDTGEVLVVGERTLWLVDPESRACRPVLDLEVAQGCRANEAALTRDGGLAVATMAYDATPGAGTVLVVRPDGFVCTALSGTTVSNGTAYLDDGVLFVDSLTREIVAYREEGEHWSPSSTVARMAPDDGLPDGICVDAEQAVWVALWGGGQVQRWSSTGALLDVVALPVTQPTSVALGGEDGRTLLITTSAYQLPDAHGTPAGALFTTRVDVPASREPALPHASVMAWSARQAAALSRDAGASRDS